MASKADFTQDEWRALLQSPMIAGVAVSAADPSGIFGMLKESMASARALFSVKSDPSADALVKAVAADFETSEGRVLAQQGLKETLTGGAPGEIKTKAIDALRRVTTILETKAPSDAAAYKTWLAHVAKSVAEAASEGGFLGFGGVQISDAEKATLAEISGALGLPS